jgi:hypothetical protein
MHILFKIKVKIIVHIKWSYNSLPPYHVGYGIYNEYYTFEPIVQSLSNTCSHSHT